MIILFVIIICSVGISTYYYSTVRQALSTRANAAATAFKRYSEDATVTDLPARIRSYVAEYSQSDNQVELMIIDSAGVITLTSSGFEPDLQSNLPDYADALAAPDGTGLFIGHYNGERVMALTMLAPQDLHSTLSAVRLMVSLSAVDRQISLLIAFIVLLGILVLAMVLFSSSYFISSIINPIGEVGETARKIAQGDFSVRLAKKTDDEIGELCDIINYMAGELMTAEQVKNDFISGISHELRTPMTAIQGWGETILLDGGEDKETLLKGMGVIISETGRLSHMVEELLDFSRMQSGQLKLVKAKVDPLAELSEAVLMYTQRASREQIAIYFEESELSAPVYGDKNKLRQVFVNIIDNAIKYSDPGGCVTITTGMVDEKLIISVADKGIGIRAEDLSKVKQKFFKANSTRRGSGIGLALADEIVTRHGGSMEIDSVYGAGTTVTITLPVYKGQDESVKVPDASDIHERDPQ